MVSKTLRRSGSGGRPRKSGGSLLEEKRHLLAGHRFKHRNRLCDRCCVCKSSGFFKERFSSDGGFQFLAFILGDQFLLLTTLTILLTVVFPRYFERLRGSQEIGTYLIYLFFVVIGIPADLRIILMNAPLLLAFVFVIAMSNLLVSLFCGKLFRFRLDEILLACNASVGGPTTAAAMAIAKGWRGLVAPVMLVGTFGYLIGNYVGTFLGTWFSTLL